MMQAFALTLCALLQDGNSSAPRPTAPLLKLLGSIEMPKVEGRIDHMALDRKHQRLFVAALANNTLEVLDVAGGAHLKSVAGLSEPQGIVCLDDSDRVAVACGKSGTLEVFDATSLDKIASVKIGADADNVRFEPKQKVLVVAFGDGGLAIVDAKSWKVSGQVTLDAHPESFQLDAAGTTAWVNVPNKSAIAIVDLARKQVTGRIDVAAAKKNYPMVFLEADARLVVGCREPAKLLTFDSKSSKLVSEVRLSGDVDDLFFDAGRGFLYASCGEGSIDVFERAAGGDWKLLEKVPTAAGARTCLFVPEEKKLFVAVPHKGAQRAEVRVLSTAP